MDILRALATPNMDIRKKTLDIALELVSPQNIDEAILYLKKEISKTQSAGFEKAYYSSFSFIDITNEHFLLNPTGWRVSADADPGYPRMRGQVSISGKQCGACSDGLPW